MATATAVTLPLVLDLDTAERVVVRLERDLTDDEFFDFCQQPRYELFQIERNANGEIIFMAPVGFEGGCIESAVVFELRKWAKLDGSGRAFGPNAGINLPDGSTFAPDAFWVPNEVWRAIPLAKRQQFGSIVPTFVIEARSRSDRKKDLHEKMLAYMRNGVELGWFIDPLSRTVRIYKQGEEFIELNDPPRFEGEGPVAGFVLDLKQIYDELDL